MDTSRILRYVTGWTTHNTPAWLQAHIDDYRQARADLEQLAICLNSAIREFDPSILILQPKHMIPDILPDRPSLRIHIAPEGMKPIPVGYYLCIRPGDRSFLSGGLYSSIFRAAADMIRNRILDDPLEWFSILNAPDFQSRFTLLGKPLSNFPAEFDPKHPYAKYLQQNNWYVRYSIRDELLLEPGAFESTAIEVFRAMSPFIQYLNRALNSFHLRT